MDRSILAALILTCTPAVGAAQGIPGCTQGVFDLRNQNLRPDGSHAVSRATSTDYCGLFGGELRVAEFRALDGQGQTVFRGVSLAVPSADRTEERIFWAMVGDPGYTTPVGHMEGGVLVHRGEGADGMGRFEERSETRYRDDGGYRFEMDRRYEGRDRWLKDFNIIDATRVETEVPPLPQALAIEHPAARGTGTWHHMGRVQLQAEGFTPRHVVEQREVILDGHAVVSRRTHLGRDDEHLGRSYTFETLHQGRWRVLEWEPASGEVTAQEFDGEHPEVVADTAAGRMVQTEEGGSRHRLVEEGGALVSEWWLHQRDPGRPYGEPVPAQACGEYRFVLGDFRTDAASMNPDRTRKLGVGFVSGQSLVEDRILSAEMHVMFMDGTGFRGTTLRSRDAEGRWHVTWVAEGTPTTSSGLSENDTDACVEVFRGEDGHGPFSGHLVISHHDEQGFDVTMDRRYPGGPTIPGLWTYSARRLP